MAPAKVPFGCFFIVSDPTWAKLPGAPNMAYLSSDFFTFRDRENKRFLDGSAGGEYFLYFGKPLHATQGKGAAQLISARYLLCENASKFARVKGVFLIGKICGPKLVQKCDQFNAPKMSILGTLNTWRLYKLAAQKIYKGCRVTQFQSAYGAEFSYQHYVFPDLGRFFVGFGLLFMAVEVLRSILRRVQCPLRIYKIYMP